MARALARNERAGAGWQDDGSLPPGDSGFYRVSRQPRKPRAVTSHPKTFSFTTNSIIAARQTAGRNLSVKFKRRITSGSSSTTLEQSRHSLRALPEVGRRDLHPWASVETHGAAEGDWPGAILSVITRAQLSDVASSKARTRLIGARSSIRADQNQNWWRFPIGT